VSHAPGAEAVDALVTPAHVAAARARIAPHVRRTPLEPSPALSARVGAPVYLKLESMQVTGSFKPRISFNKLLTMTPDERARGVVASTAGGHGVGLAYAAERLGVDARIFLPAAADPRKVAVMRRHGATLAFFDSVAAARVAAQEEARRTGRTFVSAYNDPAVIAGGGTVGAEVVEERPDVGLLAVGIGGGGLIAGSAVAVRDRNPAARVWGVQPEASAVLARWLAAGRPVDWDPAPSIADGLGARIERDSITFPLAQRHVDRVALVTEAEIRGAMAWLLDEHQLVVEPSGAAPVAALLAAGPDAAAAAAGGSVVAVVTGRNVGAARFLGLVAPAFA
jgi:threonine dehydratase